MESIVYAVDWNQVRENVFGGAAWLGGSGGGGAEVIEQLRKPTALVCSARGAEKTAMAGGRKKRDDLLLDMIRSTVAKGGTVLIPTDTSARVLEIAYVLEHAWRKEAADATSASPLKSAKLYLASRYVGATMRYARSMLEWMDESVVRNFESESTNSANREQKHTNSRQNQNQAIAGRDSQGSSKPSGPFEFRFLKMIEHKRRIEKLTSTKGPRVILASDTSLVWGFSKDVLQRIAADPANLIILTEEVSKEKKSGDQKVGLRDTLWEWYQDRKNDVNKHSGSDSSLLERARAGHRDLEFSNAQCINLEGKELLIYQQYLATRQQAQNVAQTSNGTNLESSADAEEDASSSSSSSPEESDPERQGKALNTSIKTARFNRNRIEPTKETIGVNVLLRQPGVYDYDVRGKKGREQMFPYANRRRRGDDFGELIRPEDYLRAEERDEFNGQDMRDDGSRKQEGLGQKRKWQETGLQGDSGQSGADGRNKKRQSSKDATNQLMSNGGEAPRVNGHAAAKEDDSSDESGSDVEGIVTAPSKLIFKTQTVNADLEIAFVDFIGLHDQRSLSMLIPLIQPKKIILTGGDFSETAYLAQDCEQKLKSEAASEADKHGKFVFTPSNGQMIDASVDTNTWTVKLSEALVRRLHWQNVRGLGVVTLMGHLTATSKEEEPAADAINRKKLKLLSSKTEESKPTELPVSSDKQADMVPTLDVLPTNMAAATRSAALPLHVGDLRLADLRKILQSTGHSAEFRGEGTLLIDGLVAVRKSGAGKIEVEGGGLNLPEIRTRTLEGPFYAVKRKIYDGLAIIAGG